VEVLAKYENGFRFSAICKEYTVAMGRGEDGNKERDGMWPAQLFEASIGMCIGGYIADFCKEQDIPHEDMTIELSRRIEANSLGGELIIVALTNKFRQVNYTSGWGRDLNVVSEMPW
jgi:organic hydroperoxide reductase OsmC/OhrA